MCYTAKYLIEKALKRARHYGVAEDIKRYKEELKQFKDLEKASGFSHPQIIIYTNQEPYHPVLSYWGLIPHWIKDKTQANSIWNKTLNARVESIFEKPSFREAAHHRRCLIPIAGFYEYHHVGKSAIPYYVCRKDDEPMQLAGLWSEWLNPDTGEVVNSCSIVTTKANELMAQVHNNPKNMESRMPLILPDQHEDRWLWLEATKSPIEQLLPFPQELLQVVPEQNSNIQV